MSAPNKKSVYKVLYGFKGKGPLELTVAKGDLVYSLGPEEKGWMKVKLVKNPASEGGLVPISFLKPSTAIARPGIKKAEIPAAPTAGPPVVVERSGDNAAIQHAECSICCRPMIAERPTSYLLKADGKRRTCRHYFHRSCLMKRLKQKAVPHCVVCHTPYEGFADVPDFEVDPEGFFQVVDFDRNHRLNQGEVIAALKALVDVDYKKIEQDADTLWDLWDKNLDGTISFQEMMRPKTGLLHYVRSRYPVEKAAPQVAPPPVLSDKTKKAFFDYWDEDKSGTLSVDEICRAVIKTYLKDDLSTAELVRTTMEALWPMFDHDGSGALDEDEFCKAGGLADTLMANFQG